MKTLPNIKLQRQEINRILSSVYKEGGEAAVCHGYNANTLYKIFIDHSKASASMFLTASQLSYMSDNKLQKIIALYNDANEDFVQPIATLSYRGKLIGYEMTYDHNDLSMLHQHSQSESREALISILDSSKDILLRLAQKDIIYGDIARRNVLVNQKTGKVKLCDVDNVQYGEYPIDVKNVFVKTYERLRKIDPSVDAFLHNLMTLSALDYDLDACLDDEAYFSERFTKEAIPVIKTFEDLTTFSGEYLVQYVKKKQ